ncbi:MerR family transcriptional regulator [Ilumatobacter sp.]|uniref:MerR family transcriptional regulator n=1 Tax=Ilumatobacter sp. TaxID=1967498 RepID=UPI003AF493E1
MSTTTDEFLTPAEMADACGVSIDTLRYYEREGLLQPVARTDTGRRRYSADDAAWVRVLRCLRVTAMPIREMREFAELVRRGDEAIPERLDILLRHRGDVVAKLDELHRAIEVIDEKIAAYSTETVATPHADAEPHTRRPTLDGKGVRA